MQLSKFVAGLIILKAHFTGEDGYHTAAEHDQFFVYPTDTPLTQDEFTALTNLGWFQTDTSNKETVYDPQAGWSRNQIQDPWASPVDRVHSRRV